MLQFGITNHPPGANRKANKGGGDWKTPHCLGDGTSTCSCTETFLFIHHLIFLPKINEITSVVVPKSDLLPWNYRGVLFTIPSATYKPFYF